MPVLTRSKRKLLSADNIVNVNSDCPVKLSDITNSKRKKHNNDPEKSKMQGKATISQRNTHPVPLKLTSAATAKSNVTKKLEPEPVIEISQKPARQPPTQAEIEDAGVTMMRKIKKMLENNFKNVAERLQLDPVPACLHNLRNCHDHHSKSLSVPTASIMIKNTAMGYLKAERLFQLLHYVRHNICGQKLFPGADILINILQKMMVRNANRLFINKTKIIFDL